MNKLAPLFVGTALSSLMLPGQAADPPKPYGAVPTPQQVNWQRMEFYGFIHFGLNTFTGREWGYGDENPQIFNPTDFNASEIVETFKKGGMKGMIYTAKHHDGFCAWPTKSTEHNITKTPWKNGKGDVVKEFALACKKHGIKFGTYLSPWDRNHAEYGKEGYLKAYYQQIRELLSNYGPVFEIWFDGANGGDGYYGGAREKRNIGNAEKYYNFEKIVEMIRSIQPNCIIWGAGHYGDARWGGSEKGHVNYPHWSTVGLNGGGGGTGKRGGERWVPAEGDTTINHSGWFWHQGQASRVKSPEELMQVWFDSVGRGANLILNVAADKTGKLDPADVKSLMEFKELRDKLYAKNFALGATATASQTRGNDKKFSPSNMTDGNMDTYWAVEDDNLTPSAVITLPKPATFDVSDCANKSAWASVWTPSTSTLSSRANGSASTTEEKPSATRSCAGLTAPSPPRSCACASRAARQRPASLNSPCSASLQEPSARPSSAAATTWSSWRTVRTKSSTRRTEANPRPGPPSIRREPNSAKAELSRHAASLPTASSAPSARQNSASAKPDGK